MRKWNIKNVYVVKSAKENEENVKQKEVSASALYCRKEDLVTPSF